jgi:CcmD family protein
MQNMKRHLIGLCIMIVVAFAALADTRPAAEASRAEALLAQRAPAGQEEFVPIAELPPEEQLAAGPLLVGAYAFAWVAVLAYLGFIWRRLGRVERELEGMARRVVEEERRL